MRGCRSREQLAKPGSDLPVSLVGTEESGR